jgi:hypothetical protein
LSLQLGTLTSTTTSSRRLDFSRELLSREREVRVKPRKHPRNEGRRFKSAALHHLVLICRRLRRIARNRRVSARFCALRADAPPWRRGRQAITRAVGIECKFGATGASPRSL